MNNILTDHLSDSPLPRSLLEPASIKSSVNCSTASLTLKLTLQLLLVMTDLGSLLNGPRQVVDVAVDVAVGDLTEVRAVFVTPVRTIAECSVGGRGNRAERNTYPPYIHFTLQKANRDTQDALAHLSRQLRVNVKDLSVAGTKDKRGVTVQRVSLRRGNKTVENVWTMANNVGSQRTEEEALTHRGERGIRVADFNYRKASLELGMLKGNAFVITLR